MYGPFKQSPTKKLWFWVIKLIVQRELDNRKWQNGHVWNSKAETCSCAGCESHKVTQAGSQWGLKSCLRPPSHMRSCVHPDRTPFPCVHKGCSGLPVARSSSWYWLLINPVTRGSDDQTTFPKESSTQEASKFV